VFEGGRMVANLDIKDHSSIVGVYDLDGDGVNELFIEDGWIGQGYYGSWSSLVEVKGQRQRVVGKFGAFDDNCGALGTRGRWKSR
jgi:hypothetical protein